MTVTIKGTIPALRGPPVEPNRLMTVAMTKPTSQAAIMRAHTANATPESAAVQQPARTAISEAAPKKPIKDWRNLIVND
ncbi:MAG: hypothetical protein K2X59_07695 [Sphingomonas sp.]|nr:hypothetical protein [Sphingomonas sp.]